MAEKIIPIEEIRKQSQTYTLNIIFLDNAISFRLYDVGQAKEVGDWQKIIGLEAMVVQLYYKLTPFIVGTRNDYINKLKRRIKENIAKLGEMKKNPFYRRKRGRFFYLFNIQLLYKDIVQCFWVVPGLLPAISKPTIFRTAKSFEYERKRQAEIRKIEIAEYKKILKSLHVKGNEKEKILQALEKDGNDEEEVKKINLAKQEMEKAEAERRGILTPPSKK